MSNAIIAATAIAAAQSNVLSKDLFNFADLSDLPEDLQKSLSRETDDKVREFANIVMSAVAHGHKSLNMGQIKAVATRVGMTVPGDQTVRGYLNRAVELMLIGKPTRVTYGSYADHDAAAVDPVEPAAPEPTPEADPLAGVI